MSVDGVPSDDAMLGPTAQRVSVDAEALGDLAAREHTAISEAG